MSSDNSDIDVVIVGAGAAGIGAAKTLRQRGIGFKVLEASHRIGGRAYTEAIAPGVPFDLGCHWMHSASINPMVAIADKLGLSYVQENRPQRIYAHGAWVSDAECADWETFSAQCDARIVDAVKAGDDRSVADLIDREHRWTAMYDYWNSLLTSVDSDQVSAVDLADYRDTGENWPLKEGYGTLMARFGADVPVALNSAVERIDARGATLKLHTSKGTLAARRVIVTVSTGVLGAGDIRFDPVLPDWKQAAIADLPLGNHNRICLLFDRNVFGPDQHLHATMLPESGEPMAFSIRPFGYDYVVGFTGGRHADWLEKAGSEASAALAKEHLVSIYGADIVKHITRHSVTAWRGDPWVRGAYAANAPGCGNRRALLARPIDERLYFAGEATSPEFFSTAHGAYLSGVATANTVADGLRKP